MPLDLFEIKDVEPFTTRTGRTLYVIKAQTVEQYADLRRLKTFKPFEASLCQRAVDLKRLIWIDWRRGFGLDDGDIVKVGGFDTSRWGSSEPAA